MVAYANNNGFGSPSLKVNSFGYSAGSWRVDRHPRMVVDINKDGKADIIGFGSAGVFVARSYGSGFHATQLEYSDYGYSAGGWR